MANCATLQRQLLHSQTCLGGEGEAAHQGSCHVDAGCSRVCAVHPRGLWEAEEAIRVLHVELGARMRRVCWVLMSVSYAKLVLGLRLEVPQGCASRSTQGRANPLALDVPRPFGRH